MDIIKVSLKLPCDEYYQLKRYAEDQKIITTDAFRRAIKLLLFIDRWKKEGWKVLFEKGSKVREMIFRW